MQLSKFCDYGLRALMYLGARKGRVTAAEEIAGAFAVSQNHIVKSLQALSREGLVRSVPGRGGGYVFEGAAGGIRIGDVVEKIEPNFHMAECFSPPQNTCPLTPECGLQAALVDARDAFLDTLNRYTLDDLIAPQRGKLLAIG